MKKIYNINNVYAHLDFYEISTSFFHTPSRLMPLIMLEGFFDFFKLSLRSDKSPSPSFLPFLKPPEYMYF